MTRILAPLSLLLFVSIALLLYPSAAPDIIGGRVIASSLVADSGWYQTRGGVALTPVKDDLVSAAFAGGHVEFRAKGVHQCWSNKDIGFKCEVEGHFSDCDEAFRKLKMEDCCPKAHAGDGSIGFTLEYCSPI